MSAFSQFSLLPSISAIAGARSVRRRQPPILMAVRGCRQRTGFLAGLTVTQISAFSIVFVTMSILLSHVGVAALGLTTLFGLLTIALSTDMFRSSQWLSERRSNDVPEVVIFALGRSGSRLTQLPEAGAPAVLYPLRDAVGYTVKHVVALIRPEENAP